MKKRRLLFFYIILFIGTYNTIAQDKEINPKLLKEACDCLWKVDINLPDNEKNDSIRKCVTSSIISEQTGNIMSELLKTLDTINLSGIKDGPVTIKSDENIVITVDKDYDEILNRLMKDCPALNQLMVTNNTPHKNSYSDNSKALEFYKQGQLYLEKEQYESAIVEFNKAVKKDPNFAFAWDNLGISYRRTNRLRQAIECYDKSLTLDPRGSVPLMNKAAAFEMLKEYQNSIIAYNKYIEIYPDDAEGFYGVSRVQNFTKDYANALENALKAFSIYDDAGSAYKEDAINVIREIIVNLRKEDKLDIYNTFAKKHGLEKIEK